MELQGDSLELFLGYLVYFRRYRHFRPSSLKKAKIHATVNFNPQSDFRANMSRFGAKNPTWKGYCTKFWSKV